MSLRPTELLFVSDVIAELDAARGAGMQAIHCLRDRDVAAADPDAVRSFDAIVG
jgi:methionine salvage enolase-phosphatase E1